jgi:ribonuclease HI
MPKKEAEMKETKEKFYIIGSGGVGWAWVRIDRFTKRIKRVEKVTGDEASYLGLIDVLKFVGCGGRLLVITDSQKLHDQLHGKRVYKEPRLRELRNEVRKLIEEQTLEVEVKYVSRYNHPIGRLLNPLMEQVELERDRERHPERFQDRDCD